MQQILKQAQNCNYEDDALVLSKAAKIVREDIMTPIAFNFLTPFFPTASKILYQQSLNI